MMFLVCTNHWKFNSYCELCLRGLKVEGFVEGVRIISETL